MKRRVIIIIVATAVAFSLVSLVAPFDKNSAFWQAYLFGMISIVTQLYFFKSAAAGANSARSKVYGFPIARIGVIYAIIQLISSLLQMGFSHHLPPWIGFVANVVVLVLALVGCFSTEAARDVVIRQDALVASNIDKMSDIRLATDSLVAKNKNASLDDELKDLAEKVRFSDPLSSEDTAKIEDEISYTLAELEKSLSANDTARTCDLIERAQICIDERNRICKAHKQPQ